MRGSARPQRIAAAVLCAVAPMLLAGLLVLLAGCAGKPPVISRVYARVIYVRDSGTGMSYESLGVFLIASDPDGVENLSAFYVINDEAELFWKVDSTSWVTSTAEGESWIGSTALSMPGPTKIPEGRYRVVLQDVGGDTVEDTFTVPARTVGAADAAYPSSSVTGGIIKVSGPYPSYEVWTYGPDGKFVAAFPAGGKSPPLELSSIAFSAPALANGFTYRVFAWDEKAGYGVLSGPYSSGTFTGR